MTMTCKAGEDCPIATMESTVEKVRSESREVVETWVARIDRADVKTKIAEWKRKNHGEPLSERIRQLLLCEDSVA